MTVSVVTSVIASEAKQSRAGEPEQTQIASSLRPRNDALTPTIFPAMCASTFSTGKQPPIAAG
jgi:hypothetical protein